MYPVWVIVITVWASSIKAALDAEIIDEGNIAEVGGVPFALVLI